MIRKLVRKRYSRSLINRARPTAGATLVAVVMLALVIACSGKADNKQIEFGSSQDQAIAPGDPGVVHVHGLGINPADNTLYAATHTGLFQIVAGRATRVGGNFQDTMGFTIVGPNEFMGSGHPDAQAYTSGRLPPLLGLIQSSDAGRIWKSVSLLGKSDFHGLRVAHGLLYGYDSSNQSFMVSSDSGGSWDTRSKVVLYDFAVSPDAADRIVATNATELLASVDRGKTWQRLQGPVPLVLGWQMTSRLWGLDKVGNVMLSRDQGVSWQAQGSVAGVPEAFFDTGTTLYAAVRGQGILESKDDGKTWQVFYR